MHKLIIVHSGDLHGAVNSIPRIATLVDQIRHDNPDASVIFMDTGDAQDKDDPLSEATEGAALYRLLGEAGCQASVVSNKCMKRYGLDILPTWQEAGNFPILCCNLAMPDGETIPGTQPHMILDAGGVMLGVVGVTDPDAKYVEKFGLTVRPLIASIRDAIAEVRAAGADAVILASHLGLYDDQDVADAFPDLPLILGGHSHIFSAYGFERNNALISHIGAFGSHIARVDLIWDRAELHIDRYEVIDLRRNIQPKREIVEVIEGYS